MDKDELTNLIIDNLSNSNEDQVRYDALPICRSYSAGKASW